MADDKLTVDIDQFAKKIDRIGSIAMPRAVSDALTSIAFDAQKDLKADAASTFDRPTKFTLRGFSVKKATFKSDPIEATVLILPNQAKYLKFQILGGVRRRGDIGVTGGGVLLPVGIRLNKFGNFPQGPIRYLATLGSRSEKKKSDTFVSVRKGTLGLWKRPKGKKRSTGRLRLLAAFKESARFDKGNFDFFNIIQTRFLKDFEKTFINKFEDGVKRVK